jgi:hypothetical protein
MIGKWFSQNPRRWQGAKSISLPLHLCHIPLCASRRFACEEGLFVFPIALRAT